MRRIIRIRRHAFVGERSDNMLISANLVQGLPTWNLKWTYNLPIFYFQETVENYSSAAYKCYEIITPREKSQRNKLSI